MLKVLIVDDDEIVLLVQRKILHRCGITNDPVSFNKAGAAIEYLKEQKKGEFLILLDINMPGMNGWQFLQELEELNLTAEVYVIMVTSSIDNYDKEEATNYKNVIGFIEKPITNQNCSKIKSLREISRFFD